MFPCFRTAAGCEGLIRFTWVRLVLVVTAGLLAGCGWFRLPFLGQTPTPTPTLVPTPSFLPTVTETVAEVTCAFVWSSRSLPDVSIQINQALRASGLANAQAEASAYGEDCIDSQTNQVIRFTAMQTDVYVVVAVEQVDDSQEMGEWVENLMRVLEDFRPGQVPGPNPGYVGISFVAGAQTTNLSFPRAEAESLIKDGLRGSALFEALQNP